MSIEQKLLKLKTKIEDATQTKTEKGAELKLLFKRLKDEFEVDNLEDAEDLLNELGGDVEKLKTKIDKKVEELAEEYL